MEKRCVVAMVVVVVVMMMVGVVAVVAGLAPGMMVNVGVGVVVRYEE